MNIMDFEKIVELLFHCIYFEYEIKLGFWVRFGLLLFTSKSRHHHVNLGDRTYGDGFVGEWRRRGQVRMVSGDRSLVVEGTLWEAVLVSGELGNQVLIEASFKWFCG